MASTNRNRLSVFLLTVALPAAVGVAFLTVVPDLVPWRWLALGARSVGGLALFFVAVLAVGFVADARAARRRPPPRN